MNWREKFGFWSTGPGKSEQEKLDRVVSDISETLRNDPVLNSRQTEVFAQGSYANRVNVKKDSDVDVCCLHPDVYFHDKPSGYSVTDLVPDFTPAVYRFSDYKNDVENALVRRYGRLNVSRGNKAFDVHSKVHDIDADVVPTFSYKDFRIFGAYSNPAVGTALISDKGEFCTNYPHQQYDNGVAKHSETSRRFKRQVRVQKNLRNHINEQGLEVSKPIASFLLESLCWCAPNSCYGHADYYDDFEHVMRWIYQKTESDAEVAGLLEVNGIKRLFDANNPWSRLQVRNYVEVAWEITH